MRILFVTQVGRHYARLVDELRKRHHVEHLFIDSKWELEHGNYHIPKLLGRHIGYKLVESLLTHYLLLRRKYDFCITDYVSAFRPFIMCIIKHSINSVNTKYIHDIRTIPVGYPEHLARKVESEFSRQLRFANRFYHGISLITEEMKIHIEKKYMHLTKPWCIWESGVDTSVFKPAPKNITLKRKLGFEESDFVCFHHGIISDTRGIIDLVQSLAIVKSREKKIKLFVLGQGHSYAKVQTIINELGLQHTVKLNDWVEFHKVPHYLSIADLCIVPLPDIEWWRVSSPLKLMEYIGCGKNILLTDIVAHTNVVGRNTEYFWIHDVTAESLANKIMEAYKCFQANPDQFFEKGIRERKRLVNKISWESRSRDLEQFLLTLNASG